MSQAKSSGALLIKPIDFSQINAAYMMVVNEDTGLALLSAFGIALRKLDSAFDPRNFGFVSFSKFCQSLAPDFVIVKHKDGTTLSLKKKE